MGSYGKEKEKSNFDMEPNSSEKEEGAGWTSGVGTGGKRRARRGKGMSGEQKKVVNHKPGTPKSWDGWTEGMNKVSLSTKEIHTKTRGLNYKKGNIIYSCTTQVWTSQVHLHTNFFFSINILSILDSTAASTSLSKGASASAGSTNSRSRITVYTPRLVESADTGRPTLGLEYPWILVSMEPPHPTPSQFPRGH